jgi:hypothetical protein
VAGVAFGVQAATSGSGTPSATASPGSTGGTPFTSKDGHFSAKFPAQPTEIAIPAQAAGTVQVALHGATCSNPMTEVALETTSQPVQPFQQQDFMQLALSSIATPVGLVDDGEAASTYKGHPARTATFNSSDGKQVTAMAVFYSTSRLYVLVAGRGAAFTNLLSSFEALP